MDEIFNTRTCLKPEEITAYLEQRLSDEERFAIENHLLDCPLCEAALEGFAQANPTTTTKHLAEIKTALPGSAPTNTTLPTGEAKLRRLPAWRNWAAAAAAVALLITAGIIYTRQGPISSSELFAEAYVPYESPFVGTRSATDNELPLNAGLAAFQEGNYSQAVEHFDEVLIQSPEESMAHLHAGMAYLHLGKTEQAIEHLTTVRMNTPILYGSASWYLALAYLKSNDPEQSKAILEQILPKEKEFYDRAQLLLKQLTRVEE